MKKIIGRWLFDSAATIVALCLYVLIVCYAHIQMWKEKWKQKSVKQA